MSCASASSRGLCGREVGRFGSPLLVPRRRHACSALNCSAVTSEIAAESAAPRRVSLWAAIAPEPRFALIGDLPDGVFAHAAFQPLPNRGLENEKGRVLLVVAPDQVADVLAVALEPAGSDPRALTH